MTLLEEMRVMARGQAYRDWLRGRRVSVVGLGRSGLAAARLLVACGARVVATDEKPLPSLGVEARALETLGARILAGGHPAEAFRGADLVVVSPGVPLDTPVLAQLRAVTPVIGELELAWRVMDADTIAITGTHGKTTTTARLAALDHGAFVRDGWIVAKLNGHAEEICPLAEIALRGAHNVENVLAATAGALWTGMAPDAIRRGIGVFRGVPHRIEFVRDIGGVAFFNDSKGTNVASTIRALERFGEPIGLIAGGKGKGQDFGPLAQVARGRVGHAVLIGEDGEKVGQALQAAGVPVTPAASFEAAIRTARGLAGPGHVVLLSPACASFDMFDSFEHRGDVFRALVLALPEH